MIFLQNLIEAVQLRILVTGQRLNLGKLIYQQNFAAESTKK